MYRTVTVIAGFYEEAVDKAWVKLDKLADKYGDEAPVGWDLTLDEVYSVKQKELKDESK